MTLCDQCETASHCLKNGCIPLTECIASGQVSAAQVVAHAEAGELPEPFGFLTPTDRSPAFHYMRRQYEKGMSVFTADQLQDYATTARTEAMQELAAAREQVRVLRRALTIAVRQNEHDMAMTGDELRACRLVLAATQQGANHE